VLTNGALIWWEALCVLDKPKTWNDLKIIMREIFVQQHLEEVVSIAPPSMPNLLQDSEQKQQDKDDANESEDSVEKHCVHSDQRAYMLAENFGRDDTLQNWNHGHISPHNFRSLCFRNPVLLCVVQDRFREQSTPRTAFRQEGEDDEDMPPMHMVMIGPWHGEDGGQQGCPSH
ncbi:unnamed protein product, partial [Urochloa humidicola]